MALQTATVVNGEWTTQTLDVDAILQHYNEEDRQANTSATQDVEKAPVLGLLTQTVLRSPLAHWILPVHLRGPEYTDVAFIGDGFVHIKELRKDGHLWDIAFKDNFGTRIRNARVARSLKAYQNDYDYLHDGTQIKPEDDDIMDTGELPASFILPPQFIILQLETNDSVFLMLRKSKNGGWQFVSSRHRLSKTMHKLQSGIHLAVDPSSRYMAVGSSEGAFAIFALNSREELAKQSRNSASNEYKLSHVKSERYIYLHGIILKMEFLYPSPDDDEQIILLVVLVNKGRTRMLIYEWVRGGDLTKIHKHSKSGLLLQASRQIPLLVIPLTIRSSFILVSENSLAVCEGIMHGSPRFLELGAENSDPPTSFHHGLNLPLWTAWSRPPRLPHHTAENDVVYIVREDGLVRCLEMHTEDGIQADMTVGFFNSNCGNALASLSYQGYEGMRTGDFLITGGDSGAGGAYLIKARDSPVFHQSIQNWSPVHDFVTTSKNQDHNHPTKTQNSAFLEQDKIYACVGKESNGAIVEFRHGFEAHIGLEMEFHTQIMDIWTIPPDALSFDSEDTGPLFLLSLPHCSAILQLSMDASGVQELEQHMTNFDLRHRTLTAGVFGSRKIQVTERSVVIIEGPHLHMKESNELLGIYEQESFVGCGREVSHAALNEDCVVFSTSIKSATYLQVLRLQISEVMIGEDLEPSLTTSIQTIMSRENLDRITSLAICPVKGLLCAVFATCSADTIELTIQSLDGSLSTTVAIPATCHGGRVQLEEIISIFGSSDNQGTLILFGGTRNGLLVTLHLNEETLTVASTAYNQLGLTPVTVRQDPFSNSNDLLFATCDSRVYGVAKPFHNSPQRGCVRSTKNLNQIFLTNAQNPSLQSPPVTSVARLFPSEFGGIDDTILVAAGSQLLLAGLSTQSKTIPRRIHIGATPSRILYSHTLGLLIVAASVKRTSTLFFIDPETGADVSKPFDKKNNMAVDCISGLGKSEDRIFRLLEWSYEKDGKTWNFIVLSCGSGRVLIISTEREEVQDQMNDDPETSASASTFKMRYWTRYKFKCEKPVYSIVGVTDGLYYCAGTTLHLDTLDVVEKRFKNIAKYELPSPAIHLTYENRKIYALTSSHSLEILELVPNGRGGHKFIRTHGDQVTRNSFHHRIMASKTPIHLVSDKECSVVGLWATQNTRADGLDTVFEAQLPQSVLRFRYGNCRPIWDYTRQSTIPSIIGRTLQRPEVENAAEVEVFGMSIDGSLSHFTILDPPTWKLLRFIQNLALQSPRVCEFNYSVAEASQLTPSSEPKTMFHIDGDMLRRCLDDDVLEGLLQFDHQMLAELLGDGEGDCVSRTRERLELLLRPVL